MNESKRAEKMLQSKLELTEIEHTQKYLAESASSAFHITPTLLEPVSCIEYNLQER